MLGESIRYKTDVDGGKSKNGKIISVFTGLIVSISPEGSLVLHDRGEETVIYQPAFIQVPPQIEVASGAESSKQEEVPADLSGIDIDTVLNEFSKDRVVDELIKEASKAPIKRPTPPRAKK